MPDCLFVLPSFRAGGAEKVVIRIANALAAAGMDVEVTAIDGVGELRRDVLSDIPVHDLGVTRTRHALIKLVVLIRRLKPAVVFSSLTRVSLLLLFCRSLLPSNTKIVIRQPSIATLEMRDLQPAWLYRLLFPRLMPTADAIISQSLAMTTDLHRVLGPRGDLVTLINNPAPEVDRGAYLAMESPFNGAVNFLAVGRLSEEKGPDVLLHGFARLLVRLPAARLTILGDGPLRTEMQNLASRLGVAERVQFLGFVADPFLYYVHADVVVLASRREGFPNVLVEAAACGTPAVATDCGGVCAEIIRNGDNGYIVQGEDPDGLADAMLRAVALRSEKTPLSIAVTAARFAPDAIFAAYQQLIHNVAATGRAPG